MKVILLKGVSGSGKSTYCKNNFPDAHVVSADHFFERLGHFDPSLLADAHRECFSNFLALLGDEVETIVVDNTNITMWELAPYWRLADLQGADVEVHEILAPVQLCIARNIHEVPANAIERMARNWEECPPYVKVKKVGSVQ